MLRKTAKKVKDARHPHVAMLVQEMKQAAYTWEAQTGLRCEGLAAPQIGVSLQVIIIRRTNEQIPCRWANQEYWDTQVHTEAEQGDSNTAWHRMVPNPDYDWFMRNRMPSYDPWYVMVNPKLISCGGMQESEEGCLSVPGFYGTCIRPDKATFSYTKLDGHKTNKLIVEGFGACVLIHELFHLKGALFIDEVIGDLRRTPIAKAILPIPKEEANEKECIS